ncbi:MAG: hypothetical protein KAJ18_00180 [Candidatus Omnitrophica bacterium]|nr:hypothetical protein [Candidatus Omnitrophota bacterium]
MAQKWYQKASVQTAIVSGLFFLIGVGIPSFFEIPKLKDKIGQLEKENSDKNIEILRLKADLIPFRALALEKYTGSEQEALRKLADHLTHLENSISDVKNYSHVARLHMNGSIYDVGSQLISTSSLSRVLIGTIERLDGAQDYRCDEESIAKYHEAVEVNSRFPFSYYALAKCYSLKNDKRFYEYLEKAIEILEITTTIDGHTSYHDGVLESLRKVKEQVATMDR